MSEKSISQLDSASAVSDNSLLEVSVEDESTTSGYASKKATASMIRNMQTITLAEYNQLSPAEKNNGMYYYISDAVPEGKEIQPVIYSEDEREIGVWIDGKPLYQKTFTISQIADVNTAIDIAGIDYDEIFIAGVGTFKKHGADLQYIQNNGFYLSTDDRFQCYINKATNQIVVLANDSTHSGDICITIQYTKTTDTAGSGVWTPSGMPAVHYSTDEQIIGTWMGETLYQKTLIYTGSIVLNDSSWTTIPFTNVPNTDYCMATVVVTDCIFDNRVRLQVNNGEIKGATSQSSGQTITDMSVILQYTKPTS